MGLKSIVARFQARKAQINNRNAQRNKARLVRYKEETAAVNAQLNTYKARNDLQRLKGQVRAQKLAPILSAVKGVQALAKRAASNQKRNTAPTKEMFGVTKSADELLFGTTTKKAATTKKTKRKKLRKVYYEYK